MKLAFFATTLVECTLLRGGLKSPLIKGNPKVPLEISTYEAFIFSNRYSRLPPSDAILHHIVYHMAVFDNKGDCVVSGLFQHLFRDIDYVFTLPSGFGYSIRTVHRVPLSQLYPANEVFETDIFDDGSLLPQFID